MADKLIDVHDICDMLDMSRTHIVYIFKKYNVPKPTHDENGYRYSARKKKKWVETVIIDWIKQHGIAKERQRKIRKENFDMPSIQHYFENKKFDNYGAQMIIKTGFMANVLDLGEF